MQYLNILFLIIIGIGKSPALGGPLEFILFPGNTVDSNITYDKTEAPKILENPQFEKKNKTVLYLHGFAESPLSATVQSIVGAFMKRRFIEREFYNIVVLNWSSDAAGTITQYPIAVENAYQVGKAIAPVLIDLFGKGLNVSRFQIVGHSLGGQLAGIIGRTIKQLSNNQITLPRITALDPAGPLFVSAPLEIGPYIGINVNDAELVICIHTDAGAYGSSVITGCVDFQVNLGTRFQPGCPIGVFPPLTPEDTCSHQKSVAYFAEGVASSDPKFLATKFSLFGPTIKIYMGFDTPASAKTGLYLVSTNSAPPFSK